MISVRKLKELLHADLYPEDTDYPKHFIDSNIHNIASLQTARSFELAFVGKDFNNVSDVKKCDSAFILIDKVIYDKYKVLLPDNKLYIVPQDDYLIYNEMLMEIFYKPLKINETLWTGADKRIHKSAIVSDSSAIGTGTIIMENVVIMSGCYIGDNTTILPNTVIFANTHIGSNCRIGANCTIGSYPMVYSSEMDKGYTAMNYIGSVYIENNVDIGSQVNIDSAIVGYTLIKDGTKIGAQTHIAHDCIVGKNNYIVTQVGMAGWSQTGDNCYLSGQVGVNGRVKIGNDVTVHAKSGVHNDLPDSTTYFGTPARTKKESFRIFAALKYLPELIKRVALLEKKINNGY